MGLYAITIVVLISVCQANMTLLIPLENNVLAHYANIKRLDKKQVVDSELTMLGMLASGVRIKVHRNSLLEFNKDFGN